MTYFQSKLATVSANTYSFRHAPGGIYANHYAEECVALMKDPVIQRMAIEVQDVIDPKNPPADFMSAAFRAYTNFNGTLCRSIGGPAWAIRELVSMLKEGR